jgi:hypothetical protein
MTGWAARCVRAIGPAVLLALTIPTPAAAEPPPPSPFASADPVPPACPAQYRCVYFRYTPPPLPTVNPPPSTGIPGGPGYWGGPGGQGWQGGPWSPAEAFFEGPPPAGLVAAEGEPPSYWEAYPDEKVITVDNTHYLLATSLS